MTLTWYFDPISPFAYLALPRIEALATSHAIALRPVVFGAILGHWGQLGPAEIAPKRLHTYRLVQFTADRLGIPLRFPPAHPFRSLDALRLLTAAGAGLVATRTVFDFIWKDGRDPVAERDALAAALGLAIPDEAIEASGAKTALRAATEGAIAAGVFGVPTLQIGTDLFWGLDAMDMAEAALANPALLTSGEMARIAGLGVGVTRG